MDNLTTIARQYLEGVACCDFQKLKHLMHEEYTYTNAEGQVMAGPDMRFDSAVTSLNAFPDLSYNITNSYQSGNVVITELIMKGTRQEEMTGISPSDSPIAIPFCSIIEIRDGLIVSEREYYDKSSLFMKAGHQAIP